MTHDPEIDQEHQEHLTLLEAIYQAVQLGQDCCVIHAKLHRLFEMVLANCETEERLMEIYSYPGHQEHTDRHEELLNNLLNLCVQTETQEGQLTLDKVHELASCFSRHVREHDLQLIQFVRRRQQRETLLFQ
jgi:hemerythrin-like metal-binding protein